MVLGPFGLGGDEPWVLNGGVNSLLGQLDYDHRRRARMLKSIGPKHAYHGREQQLEEEEMDPDDPVRIFFIMSGCLFLRLCCAFEEA